MNSRGGRMTSLRPSEKVRFPGSRRDASRFARSGTQHEVADALIVGEGEAFEGECGTSAVAQEAFEALAIVLVDGPRGVEGEALLSCAQRWWWRGVANAEGERLRGEEFELGGGVVIRGGIVEAAAAVKQCDHPLDDGGKEGGDLQVGGWRETSSRIPQSR